METAARENQKRRFVVLDSLRGLCACMVVLYHFHTVGAFSGSPLARNSYLFVDFFFVLSGFVISSSYRMNIAGGFPVSRFMGLRLGRIYPLHVVMLGVFLVAQLVLAARHDPHAFQSPMTWQSLVASLTLTQTITFPHQNVWNGPSWSIAVEMWIYFAFAMLFRTARHRSTLVIICLAVAVVSAVTLGATQPRYLFADHWATFVRCAYGFSLGVIGREIVELPMSSRKMGSMGEVAAIALVVALVSLAGTGPWTLVAPPLFLGVICLFAREEGLLSAILKGRVPVLLGTLSYSIYMVHLFVLYRLDALLRIAATHDRAFAIVCESLEHCSASGSRIIGDAVLVPALLVILLVSWCTWRLIELPAQAWSRRILLGQRRSSQSAEEQEAPAF